jgi:hypothetical protein
MFGKTLISSLRAQRSNPYLIANQKTMDRHVATLLAMTGWRKYGLVTTTQRKYGFVTTGLREDGFVTTGLRKYGFVTTGLHKDGFLMAGLFTLPGRANSPVLRPVRAHHARWR